jgi:hypothetical protein
MRGSNFGQPNADAPKGGKAQIPRAGVESIRAAGGHLKSSYLRVTLVMEDKALLGGIQDLGAVVINHKVFAGIN